MIKQIALSAAFAATLTSLPAQAAGIAYISSATGYVLGGGGIATTAPWSGQRSLSGFNGYGQINWNSRCLTGRTGGQPLTWESCQGGPAQTWKLSNQRLNNEVGWCADVEGNRNGPNVRVMAWKCTGDINQRWHSQKFITIKDAVANVRDAKAAAELEKNAKNAPVGALIDPKSGALIGNDGSTLNASNKGNLVAAGGGNLVAAGGGN